jgi:hypothetical protein
MHVRMQRDGADFVLVHGAHVAERLGDDQIGLQLLEHREVERVQG